jgi:hypothetical protein
MYLSTTDQRNTLMCAGLNQTARPVKQGLQKADVPHLEQLTHTTPNISSLNSHRQKNSKHALLLQDGQDKDTLLLVSTSL